MAFVALVLALQSVTLGNPDASHPAQRAIAKVAMECSAFKANANGSWTSTRATKIGSVSLGAGGTFFPGVTVGDVDIGAQLNQQCRAAHAR